MPTYEKNKAYAAKYLGEQDEIRIRMSKKSGLKKTIQEHAALCGESVNAYIIKAVEERMRSSNRPTFEK